MPEFGSFVAAFFAMQQELPAVEKSDVAEIPNRAPTYYANLKTVTDAIYPVLARFGFLWSTQPDLDEGKPVLRYELTHISHTAGDPQQRIGLYPIYGDNKPQAIGAAITYARRYALCAVVGLTPDKEEDAEGKPLSPTTIKRRAAAAKAAKEPVDPETVPGVPLPGEPEGMITRPMQSALFAMLGELGFGGSDEASKAKARAEINRVLGAADLPAIESTKQLTIAAARVVLDGLKRELDARSGGSDQPA
jgi:hypothetical protein